MLNGHTRGVLITSQAINQLIVDIIKDTSSQFAQKSKELGAIRQFGINHLSINLSKLEIMELAK